MILLICQDRPADQNYHPNHFIKGEQLFNLTAIDLKTALINELFENPRSKTTFRALMYKITPSSSSVPMRSPIHMEPTPFKKGTKPDAVLPQNVDKPHLSASISTITYLDVSCTLDTSSDNCFIWILPAIHQIHKTSQVLKVSKLNLLMSLKNSGN